MELLKSINPGDPGRSQPGPGCIVTIGNFDGCHTGHQRLISLTLKLAKEKGCRSVAMSFSPHPEQFFRPSPSCQNLFSEEQKARAFRECGFDALLLQEFTGEFSRLTHEEFYEKILRQALDCRAIVVGEDFRFGYKREGNAAWLKERAEKDGFNVEIVSPDCSGGAPASSTRIRKLLAEGKPEACHTILGRPYLLEGVIREGQKMGRRLDCPTINLHSTSQLVPGNGVYAGFCWLEGVSEGMEPSITEMPPGVVRVAINCGTRPTFPEFGHRPVTEAHILGGIFGPGELYNRRAALYFCSYLRGDKKFAHQDSLKQQIARDIHEAEIALEKIAYRQQIPPKKL